jgi:hypothetical protein
MTQELIFFLLSSFSNLPAWTRYLYMGLYFMTVVGVSLVISPKLGIIVAIGIGVIALVVGGFLFLVRRRRQKKAAAFGSDMQQRAAGAPAAISDPARRARLEELRQSFDKGVAKFRAAGKDLYQLPWYVIAGEPGAGKTEAVRHSNIDFPPGMNDEFQGVGGTINMNWWFTNDAVILDTAGRLIFEEVEPGTTSEWHEFLDLLKKHRPNCPINGLLLVVPAESLIKDTPEEVERKSGKLARQLEEIQRRLDVRFPAYVVVSKCDLLNGFRGFFDEIRDIDATQQIVGWSNPDPLDAPFRPELVDAHIEAVTSRLGRRRLGLLLDPVPRDPKIRRTDEVDRLYALPQSLLLIAENLRRYLTTIFIAGAWSSKPLFLRGIYFTSSMREGSALDQELAQAIGLPVEKLPERRAWERERSYFLRDLFNQKVFREAGLVTRATDTRRLILRRRLTLFGAGFAAILFLLALSIFGYRSLQNSIGRQSGYWARASEQWNGDTWNPIVQRDAGAATYKYAGDNPVGPGESQQTRSLFTAAEQPLVPFHDALHVLSRTPLNISLAYRPAAKVGVEIDRDRQRAQRVVFEDSVIKPVIDAAREKMSGSAVAPRTSQALAEANALLSLVRLESGIIKRREGRPASEFNADDVLPPLLRYTAAREADPVLVYTMDRTYADARIWPADWLTAGSTLTENVPIKNGLDHFLADARRVLDQKTGGLPLLTSLIADVRQFVQAEDELTAAAKMRAPVLEVDGKVLAAYDRLKKQKETLSAHLAQAKDAGLFEDGPVSLHYAYEKLTRDFRARSDVAHAMQAEANSLLGTSGLDAAKQAIKNVGGDQHAYTLFREIREKLASIVTEMETKFGTPLPDADLVELKALDEINLTTSTTEPLQLEARWSLYQRSMSAAQDPRNDPRRIAQVGEDWKLVRAVFARIGEIRNEVASYAGRAKEKVGAICNYCLARAERVYSDEACKAYLAEAQTRIGEQVRFPLLWLPLANNPLKPEELVPGINLIEKIRADLRSPTLVNLKTPNREPLIELEKKLALLDPVHGALLTPERGVRLCTVVLLNRLEQFELSGQQTGTDVFKAIEARAGTIDHGAVVKGVDVRVVRTDAASDVELGRFKLNESFHFHIYRSPEDRSWTELAAPPNWTAIRFLHENNARPAGDGMRWRVALSPVPGKLIWLEFRFEKPLPSFDEWPGRETLGLPRTPGR